MGAYLCESMAHMGRHSQRLEEGMRTPGAGVIGYAGTGK